jgi:hypothetical protein
MKAGLLLLSFCAVAPLLGWDGEYQVVQQDPIGKFPKWTGILAGVEEELSKLLMQADGLILFPRLSPPIVLP